MVLRPVFFLRRNKPLLLGPGQEQPHKLLLLLSGKRVDERVEQRLHLGHVVGHKRLVVQVREEAHEELAVHSVRDSSVSGDGISKVLDLEGSLESRGKEASKGSHQRGKRRQNADVEVDRGGREGGLVGELSEELGGDGVVLGDKDGVGDTSQVRKQVGSHILHGADEVVESVQEDGEDDSPDDGTDPGAEETLDGLLGRNGNELVLSKGDSTQVGENVVGNDETSGHKEPEETLEDVVDDEVGLDNAKQNGHVGQAELGELEPVVVLFQRRHKEHKAQNVQTVRQESVVLEQGVEGGLQIRVVLFNEPDDVLSLQEVDGGGQEVPVERSDPGQLLLAGRLGRQVDHLLEGENLNETHQGNDPNVTSGQNREEEDNHHQRPNGTHNECLLLALRARVLGGLLQILGFSRRVSRRVERRHFGGCSGGDSGQRGRVCSGRVGVDFFRHGASIAGGERASA